MKKFYLHFYLLFNVLIVISLTMSFRYPIGLLEKDKQIQLLIHSEVLNDMSTAMGFYIGQSLTLHTISTKYQDLAQLVEILRLQFDNKYRGALENIDSTLSTELPAWNSKKNEMGELLKSKIDLDNLTKEDALNFLETVKLRIKGDMPSPIAETLLFFNPLYLKIPAQEYFDNFKKRYVSEGNDKAKGLNFQIDFPQSWAVAEGNRPNIVQKMVSQNGHGLAMLTLLVKTLPDVTIASLADLQNLLPIEDAKKSVPKGTKVNYIDYSLIDNIPTIFKEIKYNSKQGSKTLVINAYEYGIFYKNKLLIVTLGVGHPIENEAQCKIEFELYKTLFESIAGSIVILNQWKEN